MIAGGADTRASSLPAGTASLVRLLLVDDGEVLGAALRQAVGQCFDLQVEAGLERALHRLERQLFDCILLDADTTEAIEAAVVACRERAPAAAVVVLHAADAGSELVSDALRAGADDALIREPGLHPALPRLITGAIGRAALRSRLDDLGRREAAARALADVLFDLVERPILLVDDETAIRRVNAAAALLLQHPVASLEGLKLTDLVGPADRSRLVDFLRSGHDGERSTAFELLARPDSGAVTFHARRLAGDGWASLLLRLEPGGSPIPMGVAPASVASAPSEIAALAARRGRLPVGVFQLIGLQEVRESLGEQWPHVQMAVHRVAERVLGEHLTLDDRYWRNHDGDYLVLLARDDDATAAARCRRLARHIRAAVVGAMNRPETRAEGLGPGERERVGEVRLTVHDVPVEAAELAASDEPMAVIARRMEQLQREERARTRKMLGALRAESRPFFAPVTNRGGRPSPLQLLRLPSTQAAMLATLEERAADQPELLFDLDGFMLGANAELLATGTGDGQVLSLIDVHLWTLTTRPFLDRYIELCRRLPDGMARRIAFSIVGVAPGTYAQKLQRAAAVLAEHSRFRAIHIDQPRIDTIDLSAASLPLVVTRFPRVAATIERRPDRFQAFVHSVHRAEARLLLEDVPEGRWREIAELFPIDLLAVTPARAPRGVRANAMAS